MYPEYRRRDETPPSPIPNIISLVRIASFITADIVLFASAGEQLIAPALLIALGSILDLFDGKLARRLSSITERGEWLDHIAADTLMVGAVGYLAICYLGQ